MYQDLLQNHKVSLEEFCTNCKKEKELKIQKEEFIKKMDIL
jgi:hypothetical protein